jgi:aspartyl-tRNA(Asn)/glutamyl-tRNA(Gln) amidotransferase subunit B
MTWEPVIGLEIHAQLQTSTKIFCGCSTAFGAPANTHVCPVCLGFPGVLPVLNHAAVELAVQASLALGCHINDSSIFARKNYFYPDLPKGYQISQYELPLATDGLVDFEGPDGARRVRITRVHMEEDAGKSVHEGFVDSDRRTYLDFNRAGTPLIEIVTEPELRSAGDAAAFFEHLRSTLEWLGVNDGNMEEGSLRGDANVSVRPSGTSALGTKVEVKNLNSFRFLQKALEYEIHRQIDVLSSGDRVIQETRLFDSTSGHTVSMRSKEEAHDYRYFPDPDLPPVVVSKDHVDAIRRAMPELPDVTRRRFIEQYALPSYDAAQLTQSRATAEFFEGAVRAGAPPKAVSNWMMGELARLLKETSRDIAGAPVAARQLAGLIGLVENKTISGAIAKTVFEKMFASGRDADAIVAAEGLTQIDDESQIVALIDQVVTGNADAVAGYRGGKTATFGFLVGQVMKAANGKANPKRVNELLRRALDSGSRTA